MATKASQGSSDSHVTGDVTAQRRLRIVDEDGVRRFIAVRLTAPSPERLLGAIDTLVDWVRIAKQDAAEARAGGRWDVVHEIELVVGVQSRRMNLMEFAELMDDLRIRADAANR